jgi:hypothetical protein
VRWQIEGIPTTMIHTSSLEDQVAKGLVVRSEPHKVDVSKAARSDALRIHADQFPLAVVMMVLIDIKSGRFE